MGIRLPSQVPKFDHHWFNQFLLFFALLELGIVGLFESLQLLLLSSLLEHAILAIHRLLLAGCLFLNYFVRWHRLLASPVRLAEVAILEGHLLLAKTLC